MGRVKIVNMIFCAIGNYASAMVGIRENAEHSLRIVAAERRFFADYSDCDVCGMMRTAQKREQDIS